MGGYEEELFLPPNCVSHFIFASFYSLFFPPSCHLALFIGVIVQSRGGGEEERNERRVAFHSPPPRPSAP